MEEYCTDVISSEFLGYRDALREHQGKKTHWLALDFRVLVDRDKVRIREPKKFDDIGWFVPDNFPENIHSQIPRFLELHRDML